VLCVFPFCCYLAVSTSAIDCLERLVHEMTCYVSSAMLNPTLTQSLSACVCFHVCVCVCVFMLWQAIKCTSSLAETCSTHCDHKHCCILCTISVFCITFSSLLINKLVTFAGFLVELERFVIWFKAYMGLYIAFAVNSMVVTIIIFIFKDPLVKIPAVKHSEKPISGVTTCPGR